MNKLSLKDIKNIENKNNINIFFHGTSYKYAQSCIEKYGWMTKNHPTNIYKNEINYIKNLLIKYKINENRLFINRAMDNISFYFTNYFDTALTYSSINNGELINNLIIECKNLLALNINDEEIYNIENIINKFDLDADPVVYALYLDGKYINGFNDRLNHLNNLIKEYNYHLDILTYMKNNEWYSLNNIANSNIIGKYIVNNN